jgi:hypothetical protein
MMIIIWLILLLGVTRGIGLTGGRQIPMPPRPRRKESKKKEIVDYHLSMGEEISEVELNDIVNKKNK